MKFFSTPWSRLYVDEGITCPPPEQTYVQQHFKDECDIHTILRRIEAGGDSSVLQARKGFYADLTSLDVGDLAAAFDAVGVAEDAFMSLPSSVRERFGNDAYVFAEFVSDHPDQIAALFGEKAVPTEPTRENVTTTIDDASQSGGETA